MKPSMFVTALIPATVLTLVASAYMLAMFGLSRDNWAAFAFWLIPAGLAAYAVSLIVLFLVSIFGRGKS